MVISSSIIFTTECNLSSSNYLFHRYLHSNPVIFIFVDLDLLVLSCVTVSLNFSVDFKS